MIVASSILVGHSHRCREFRVMCDVIFQKVAKRLHLGGYLIGKLERAMPNLLILTDDQISVGNPSGTDTMSSPFELGVILSNHVFSGLRHFSDWRRLPLSQLLQIATLPYI